MGDITLGTLWTVLIAVCAGIASIAAALKVIKPILLRPIDDISEKIDKLSKESTQSDEEIKTSLKSIDEQVSTIQHEKLMWAYVHYGIKHNSITLETRTSLIQMYEQYVEAGKHNHIPNDYVEVISSAPIEGI